MLLIEAVYDINQELKLNQGSHLTLRLKKTFLSTSLRFSIQTFNDSDSLEFMRFFKCNKILNLGFVFRLHLEIVKERRKNLCLYLWKLMTRNLFWELFQLRTSLSLAVIWYLRKILSFLIIGEKEVFTLLDTELPTLLMINILKMMFYYMYFVCLA